MTSRSLTGELAAFAEELKFELDPFQRTSCEALQGGHSVLVCAPTGAGKTVVGEFAVHLALASGGKCFYTTPIKALSNQKFADLTARYGRESVGLLTGDQSINPHAPVVVMTTEVLRNMLYASSDALQGLSYVVMDEVHYLADRFRGAVWEEVILHLSPEVRLACLSATVSNAEEFGAWMETVRGDTAVIVDETRPVPLWQHVMVGRRMFDLFDTKSSDQKVLVDEDLVRFIKQREAADRMDNFGMPGGRGRGGPRRFFRPVPRPEVIAKLDDEGLLPAITFIFSRAGCDGALAQCVRSRLDLARAEDRAEVDAIIEKHTGDLPRGDLEVLGYWEWREGLHRGFAAHHAGMLPAFRHTVEELFVRGLVRAVFATETLALGINMPARTVVLERLVKFNGETHAELTPGEYTQLTGRAGRRGIDVEGHAVVMWHPDVDTSAVAGLASTRTYPLKSSFRPGYNMSINLVDRMGAENSRTLLERSFAQFQADRSVVGLVRGIDKSESQMRKLRSQLGDDDFLEYIQLRERIRSRERQIESQGRTDRRSAAVSALAALRRGDVVAIPAGRRQGLAVVLEPDATPGDPRPLVLTEDKWAGRISAADFPTPAQSLGHLRLPRHVDHRTARVRRDLASALRGTGIVVPGRGRTGKKSRAADDHELQSLRRALRNHPAHARPDREQLARIGERYNRIAREAESMRQQVAATTNSLARTFDRILALLAERGYVQDGEVTADGRRLARIYAEADLVVAECLRQGLWRGLGPAELAAVVSILVFESRQEGGYLGASGPTAPIRRAVDSTIAVWSQLRADEAKHRLSPTREPDLGFVTGMHSWARGDDLADALLASGDRGNPLSAGDFVRWCRQVIDMLDQIHNTADDVEVAATAAKAVKAIRRGVVAVDAA
ncbi:DEAD/DEAH box helicase [Nocardia sp. NBC_01503]|uniref:DEAD/DEAH box helicase n=1 Tax=Nocardia sp. NBC_01503 TaxID=2975997 RepID=UPI002E7AC533|nr:DEAD/DEAH box helicase [Nocardia sp. NBC_01503]WTL31571.1 DEAD/DEAH box helicase [Nocardia sp. NBC_01503]